MFLRLILVVLVTVSVNPWDTIGFTETTKVRNELIGPVRSVTVTKHGYSTIETYDRAGHLIEAVLDLTHANTGTHSFFQYNQDGHLQKSSPLTRVDDSSTENMSSMRETLRDETRRRSRRPMMDIFRVPNSRSMTNEVISGNSYQ
ncbi:MAG: hypothetical protein MRJ68_12270 [Nitrospira sp.]|nr:hypothetical protein [Nitrospira sp.]